MITLLPNKQLSYLNTKIMMPENIALKYQDLDNETNRRSILAHFLKMDESHLWPILNSYNATEKAIKILNYRELQRGEMLYGLELALELDQIISELVNQTA